MSEHLDLTDPWLWSMPYPDSKDRVLLDPVNRIPFDPEEVPVCIREDALLYGGLTSLVNRASTIRMETAYTRHVTEDDLDLGWRNNGFERRVKRADYFGFEVFGYRLEGPEHYNRIKDSWQQREEASKTKPVTRLGIDRSGYANRTRRAIATCGSPVKCFPMDVAGINNSPLERGVVEAHELFFHEYADFETYAALCGIRNVREWIMLARLGIALQEREGDKTRKLRVFSLFGRYHQDVTRKARLLGIRCDSIVKDQRDDLLEETRIMRTRIVPYHHYKKFSKPIDYTGDD